MATRNPETFSGGLTIGETSGANIGTQMKILRWGVGVFTAGGLAIAVPQITAAAIVLCQRLTVAGTSGGTIACVITPGIGFILTSQTAGALTTQTLDTSQVAWVLIMP